MTARNDDHMSIKHFSTKRKIKSSPLRAILRRIDATLLELYLTSPSSKQVTQLLTGIVVAVEQLSSDIEEATSTINDVSQANGERLDSIHAVLTEILAQTHNPFRPLPPLPVGRGNHDREQELPKKTKRQPKLDRIDKEGFGKWK